ncbi:hypothetical protein LY13_004932 [Prauserella aidingensis]|nr:hypothetical protein [Prauserella aidingensis]
MFLLSSWSPTKIHILRPKIRYRSSPSGMDLVSTSDSDDPAYGSDRHIVPKNLL